MLTHWLRGLTVLYALGPIVSGAAPITYYDLDFEDGSLGGGQQTNTNFDLPVNILNSNLDGRALFFEASSSFLQKDDQISFPINAADSALQHIGFDYFAEAGAVITNFLDIPQILRVDVRESGRHRVDLYYDIPNQQAVAFLDGSTASSIFTTLAWPGFGTNGVRFANQSSFPSASKGDFEIDNFLWEGNVAAPSASATPEPSSLALFGIGVTGLIGIRQRKRKQRGRAGIA